MDDKELDGLLTKLVGDQPLPWRLWTSCSFRRIGCDATRADGDVLHAYRQRGDGHPDLSMSEDRLHALVAIINALPNLLDTIQTLRDRLKAVEGVSQGRLVRLDAAVERAIVAEKDLAAAQEKIGRLERALFRQCQIAGACDFSACVERSSPHCHCNDAYRAALNSEEVGS